MSVRERAGTRGDGEEREADREEAAAAEAVGERAGGQHDARQRERVGVDDPLQAAQARVQVLGDARQGRVHDGDVEHQHQRWPRRPPRGSSVGSCHVGRAPGREKEGRGRAHSLAAGPRSAERTGGCRYGNLGSAWCGCPHAPTCGMDDAYLDRVLVGGRERREIVIAATTRRGRSASRRAARIAARSATARCGSSTSARPPCPGWRPSRSSTSSSRSRARGRRPRARLRAARARGRHRCSARRSSTSTCTSGRPARRHRSELAFRDRLRASPEDRAAYEALKRELAARDWPT